CLRVATNRAGRGGGIRTQLHLVRQHLLHTVLIHCDKNEIGCLPADLQSVTYAFQTDEDGRAPPLRRATGCNSLTVLRADYECTLLIAGDNDDARCAGENALWDRLIRRPH